MFVRSSSVLLVFAATLATLTTLAIVSGGAAIGASSPQGKKPAGKSTKPAAAKPAAKPPAKPSGAIDVASLVALGKKVYGANGCAACHAIGGQGGKNGPDLTKTGANPAHSLDWFDVQITNPKAHNAGSAMPAFDSSIKGKDRTALAVYMTSLGGTPKAPAAGAGTVAAATGGTSAGGVKVAPPSAAVVAKIEKAGGSVREIAQNDNRVEVDYHMAGATVNDTALVPLTGMKSVLQLNLAKTNITDAGLAHVKGLTELAELHLEGTKITDRGLTNLSGLKNLTYLNLYGTQVTDAGLVSLSGLKNLKSLYVWQTKVTPDGAAKLKTALPNVNVVMGWDAEAKPAPTTTEVKKP